jgi:hypothetical protein
VQWLTFWWIVCHLGLALIRCLPSWSHKDCLVGNMEYCSTVRELDGNGGQSNCIMILQLIDRIHFVRLWLHVPNIKHLSISNVTHFKFRSIRFRCSKCKIIIKLRKRLKVRSSDQCFPTSMTMQTADNIWNRQPPRVFHSQRKLLVTIHTLRILKSQMINH